MKNLFSLFIAALAATTLFVAEAEAKRFGGGGSFGKQYNSFSRQPSAGTPRQSTAGSTQSPASAAAANAGRTSGASRWLGPLAGLAAGGLLASLFFCDGFGGLQVMDISNPERPVSAGHYNYRVDKELGTENPTYAGSDTYDVIFGPNGYLYVSDGTSGLRVLRYTGQVPDGH